MRLQPETEHPHGLSDTEFDALFTTDRPVIFAFHGYPYLIHRLTYRRHGHHNIHVRGYKEEGTTTTPFDMVMLNDLDRFHLVMDVIDRVPGLRGRVANVRQQMTDAAAAARAPTPASTARTCPRSRAGRGRAPTARPERLRLCMRVLVVNAGSSSLKLSLLGPTTTRSSRGPDDLERRCATCRAPDAVRAPRRPRRHGLHRTGPHRRRGRGTPACPGRSGAAAPAQVAARHRRRTRGAAGRARGGVLRHRLPRPDARGRCDVRAARRVAYSAGCGGTASTDCPTRTRTRRAGAMLGGRAAAARRLPSRGRRVAVRRRGRAVGRHDDGVHAAGGPRHGHPFGQRRPWAAAVAAGAARTSRPATLADALEHRSGLLALAGTADMREIGDGLALEVYLHRLRAGIAAMAAVARRPGRPGLHRRDRRELTGGTSPRRVGSGVPRRRRGPGARRHRGRGHQPLRGRRTHPRHHRARGPGDRRRRPRGPGSVGVNPRFAVEGRRDVVRS